MSTAELRAAAERLVKDDYGCCDDNKTFQDAEDVARAYLAEHPADDDEPAEVGQCIYGEHSRLEVRISGFHRIGVFLTRWRMNHATDEVQNLFLCCVETRGDVRRLCRALGIATKEQP